MVKEKKGFISSILKGSLKTKTTGSLRSEAVMGGGYKATRNTGCVFVAFAFLLVTISTSSALELGMLSITNSSIEIYPEFNPSILHYAARCGGETTLRFELSAQPEDTQITVNGIQTSTQEAVQVAEVSDLNADSDLEIVLSDSVGSSATYVVHCLQDDVPIITAEKRLGASEQLILFSVGVRRESAQKWLSYLLIVDNNGVPRFRRRIENNVAHFKTHPSGKHPYSYAQRVGTINNFRGGTNDNSEIVVLDNNLEEIQTVQTVSPLRHTDNHDFVIRANGNYVFMAYEPVQRDFSSFTDENGNPYSTTEGTEDSIIQEVTPQGVEVFRWNYWDHMAIEDCTQHRFPWYYAHINSLQEINGDLIASFRGCSQVLKIDGSTGEVIWRLGRSNLSSDDWGNRGRTAPLPIRNDPYEEFCGQHSARILENGNLVLFDNGGHCVVDPETGTSIGTRPSDIFSRAVEYSFEMDENTDEKFVTFQRHHSLHSTFNRYAIAQGHVEPMSNGNWLISWGRGTFDDPDAPLPPDESITEVDPQTNEELLSIVIKNNGSDVILSVRAYPLSPSPDQVSGIRLSEGANQLSVSWNEATEADGYKVQWKSGLQSFDGTRQHTRTNGSTTTYTIPNLIGNTEYAVRVIATKKNTLDGTPSLQVTGTPRRVLPPPPPPPDPPPSQVSEVRLSKGVNQLSVSWNEVTEADGYKVQWKSGSQSFDDTHQHTITNGSTTTYTIPNLIGDTEYAVRVIATRKNTPDGTPSLQMTGSPEVDTLSNPSINSSFPPPSSLVNDGGGGCAIASREIKRNTSESALLNLFLIVFIPFLILWRKNLKEKQTQYFRPN